MHDQVNRDILDIGFKTAFVLKTAAEAGGFKELQEARHDAASDIDAAKRPQGQRQVSTEAPHNDAEQRQRPATVGAAIRQRPLGDLTRLQVLRQSTIRFDYRAIKVDQTRTGEDAFCGDMP